MILNYQKIFFSKNVKILMILNYQKKFFFFKKCQNFNDFKLSKKFFFQKMSKF